MVWTPPGVGNSFVGVIGFPHSTIPNGHMPSLIMQKKDMLGHFGGNHDDDDNDCCRRVAILLNFLAKGMT
jgi:hypothetical protein